MEWNLKRVLFCWSVMAGIFLGLTFINYLWPLNPHQSQDRLNIGFTLSFKELLFAISAYALINAQQMKLSIAIVLIWIAFKIIYSAYVVLSEPFSGVASGIFLGQIFMAGTLTYFTLLEIKAIKVAANTT